MEASELLRLPIFADLPDDQIAWFIGQSQELALKPVEVYVHQGDPADAMFVVLDGQLQIRGELSGGLVTFVSKPGDVTGVLPFSRMKQFPLTGRALTNSRVLRFPPVPRSSTEDAGVGQPSGGVDVGPDPRIDQN